MNRVTSIITQGAASLSKAAGHLEEIDRASERAVEEILRVMEEVRQQLETAAAARDCGVGAREHIAAATNRLLPIIQSLQFQDITAQRVRATIALLSGIDGQLASLSHLATGDPPVPQRIHAEQGTYDPEAVFDPDAAEAVQSEIDRLIDQARPPDPQASSQQSRGED